ncbi:hypothetical protein J6590_002376 [Homalodisca vitripennis]|nr:hypothetical protein J6590_002376 [Homalodisca vitripennis]
MLKIVRTALFWHKKTSLAPLDPPQRRVPYRRVKVQLLFTDLQGLVKKENELSTSSPDHDATPKWDSKNVSRYEIDQISPPSTEGGQQGKRIICSKCQKYVHKTSKALHSKYYCGRVHDESEWKLLDRLAFCMKCNRTQLPDAIEFHVKYLCRKKPIIVQCFYCPRFFKEYKGLLMHTIHAHKKKHRFQDLLSILPPADSIKAEKTPLKVVKHFTNTFSSLEAESFVEKRGIDSSDRRLHVRQKTCYTCQKCEKKLLGIHSYENHINTKCESESLYTCFYCLFKAEFVFEILDHMGEAARETAQYLRCDSSTDDRYHSCSENPDARSASLPESYEQKPIVAKVDGNLKKKSNPVVREKVRTRNSVAQINLGLGASRKNVKIGKVVLNNGIRSKRRVISKV